MDTPRTSKKLVSNPMEDFDSKLDPRLPLLQDADLKDKVVLLRVDHNVVKKGGWLALSADRVSGRSAPGDDFVENLSETTRDQ